MIAQSLAVRPDEAATQWALDLKHQERNREAWNLPRAVRTRASGTHRDGLNWAEFRERYNERRPHWALIPEEGGDPLVPAEVYASGRTIQIPRWQEWARAAQAKLEKLLKEAA